MNLSDSAAPQDISGEDSAAFDTLRRMREDILCGVLQPNQKLQFGELQRRYGMSVGTLREALSHLLSEGLVRTAAGRGFRAAPTSLDDFLDLSELRVYLETTTLADAIRNGTEAWEAEIVSSYFLLSKLPRPGPEDHLSVRQEWGRRHKRYHDALVATCRSPWSLHFRSELFDQARRYHGLSTLPPSRRRRNEHLEIRDAVLARDADLACALVEAHIRKTAELVASRQFMQEKSNVQSTDAQSARPAPRLLAQADRPHRQRAVR